MPASARGKFDKKLTHALSNVIGTSQAESNGSFPLFAAGLTSGNVFSFTITPTTGVLIADATGLASNPNNRPENITIDPTGTFLYVSNTGMGTVTEYTVNRSNGGLLQGGTVTVPLYPGLQPEDSQPGGLTTDALGKYLYVSEAGYMAAYSIDPSTGALTTVVGAGSPMLAGQSATDIGVTLDDNYAYVGVGRSRARRAVHILEFGSILHSR